MIPNGTLEQFLAVKKLNKGDMVLLTNDIPVKFVKSNKRTFTAIYDGEVRTYPIYNFKKVLNNSGN